MGRSVQRNVAFFCGAAGAAVGVFGSAFAALFIARAAFPEAVMAALDWLIPVWLFLLCGLMIGLWPGLDYLANRNPLAGALAMAGVAIGMEGLGIAALVTGSPAGFMGWPAIVGGLLLLLGASLAHAAGGTDPLTWDTLRTPRVRGLEARLNVLVAGLHLVGAPVFAFLLWRDGRVVEAVGASAIALWGLLQWHRRSDEY